MLESAKTYSLALFAYTSKSEPVPDEPNVTFPVTVELPVTLRTPAIFVFDDALTCIEFVSNDGRVTFALTTKSVPETVVFVPLNVVLAADIITFAPEIKRFAVTFAVSPASVVFADVFNDVVVIVTFVAEPTVCI